MKTICVLLFSFISFFASAQKSDTVKCSLTEMQSVRLAQLQEAKKVADEKLKELIVFIIDANGVRIEDVENVLFNENNQIVIIKKTNK